MKTPVCDLLGIDIPIFAFSHCRDVVIEVSKEVRIGAVITTDSVDRLRLEVGSRAIAIIKATEMIVGKAQ